MTVWIYTRSENSWDTGRHRWPSDMRVSGWNHKKAAMERISAVQSAIKTATGMKLNQGASRKPL